MAMEIDVLTLLIGLGAIDPDAVTTPKVLPNKKTIKWTKKS
jgi:hypothetical protein